MTFLDDPESIEDKMETIRANIGTLDQTDVDIVEEFMDMPENERTPDRIEEIEDIWWSVT